MKKIFILFLVLLSSLIFIILQGPIPQDEAYHHFADTRTLLGIPYFADTTSNLFFLIAGIFGMNFVFKNPPFDTRLSWSAFFIGIFLVAFGSIYYHLNPNSETLVLDRLPMTLAFMGIFSAIVTENLNFPFEKFFLLPLILLGVLSIFVWKETNDLRFYYFIQLAPIVAIPTIYLLYRPRYSHNGFLLLALSFYIVAKIFEKYDTPIFKTLSISGHSLKHFFAALSPFCIVFILKKRKKLVLDEDL